LVATTTSKNPFKTHYTQREPIGIDAAPAFLCLRVGAPQTLWDASKPGGGNPFQKGAAFLKKRGSFFKKRGSFFPKRAAFLKQTHPLPRCPGCQQLFSDAFCGSAIKEKGVLFLPFQE
jgi:hypothetical protein